LTNQKRCVLFAVFGLADEFFVGIIKFSGSINFFQDGFTGLDIGSYPFSRDGKYGATIVIRSTDESKLDACEKEIQSLIKEY